MNTHTTIPAYIHSFPKKEQSVLKEMYVLAKKCAPQATEAIKYGMPTFVAGENLFHFALYKNHMGFYPTPKTIEHFAKKLTKYKTSKGAIQFPLDNPLPIALIEQMMLWRIKNCIKAKKNI